MQKFKVKYLAFLIVLILTFATMLPAEAYTCRNYKGHQLCIISIKRSAKNHWEYRALVNVDGVKIPLETYNCRNSQNFFAEHSRSQNGSNIMPFAKDDTGQIICSLFKKVS